MTTELRIEGMNCAMCVRHVTNALSGVAGVAAADVHLEAGRATVQHEDADVAAMISAVEEEGYQARAA